MTLTTELGRDLTNVHSQPKFRNCLAVRVLADRHMHTQKDGADFIPLKRDGIRPWLQHGIFLNVPCLKSLFIGSGVD